MSFKIAKIDVSIYAIIIAIMLALTMQGLINAAVNGTPFNIWKQVIITALIVLSVLNCRSRIAIYTTIATTSTIITLCVYSVIIGVTAAHVIYNFFFYVAWVPFFAIGYEINEDKAGNKIINTIPLFVLISGIGCIVQLLTPYLNFLASNNTLDIQMRTENGSEQRVAFVYVASTLVAPSIFNMMALYETTRPLLKGRITSLFGVALTIIPTGSLSAVVTSFGLGIASFVNTKVRNMPLLAALIAAPLIGITVLGATNTQIELQIRRIAANQNTYSTANVDRLLYWEQAVDLISTFNIGEQLLGKGIGTTVVEKGSADKLNSVYINGESSFFQAYVEGGMIGTITRLLPFAFIFYGSMRDKNWYTLVYSLFIFIACAIAPLFGSASIAAIFGFMAGRILRGKRVKQSAANTAAPLQGLRARTRLVRGNTISYDQRLSSRP